LHTVAYFHRHRAVWRDPGREEREQRDDQQDCGTRQDELAAEELADKNR
jgi:hypothetical protein